MAVDQGRTLLVPAGIDRLLRDLIHERLGVHFEDDRLNTLMEKVQPLAAERKCHSLLDYYYLLKYEENGPEDWSRVADVLAVPETYFWRETAAIDAVVKEVVPEWFKRTSEPLRIWSAACSSGEEPSSIVMALLENGWGNHPIEVLASDASSSALAKAKRGVYRKNSFRTLPEALKQKYFQPEGNDWRLAESVQRRIQYRRANLLATEEITLLARAHIIFCRNVFIYFSPHAIRQTVAAFATRMPSGGHLFVGTSESLLRLTADFTLKELGEAFVYVRT